MPSSGVQTCALDRKSTRLNSSHTLISYAVFCLKKEKRRSEEHTSELQSHSHLVCRLLFEIKLEDEHSSALPYPGAGPSGQSSCRVAATPRRSYFFKRPGDLGVLPSFPTRPLSY